MIIHANQLGISPTLFYGTLNIRTVDENYFRIENRLYPRLFFVHPLGDNDAPVLARPDEGEISLQINGPPRCWAES